MKFHNLCKQTIVFHQRSFLWSCFGHFIDHLVSLHGAHSWQAQWCWNALKPTSHIRAWYKACSIVRLLLQSSSSTSPKTWSKFFATKSPLSAIKKTQSTSQKGIVTIPREKLSSETSFLTIWFRLLDAATAFRLRQLRIRQQKKQLNLHHKEQVFQNRTSSRWFRTA